MFQTGFPSIIRAQNCTYSVRPIPDAVRAVLSPDDGRKNCLKHVERLTETNTFKNVAYFWLYFANILAMHRPMNVKFIFN